MRKSLLFLSIASLILSGFLVYSPVSALEAEGKDVSTPAEQLVMNDSYTAFSDTEIQRRSEIVKGLFEMIFGRKPHAAEFYYWYNRFDRRRVRDLTSAMLWHRNHRRTTGTVILTSSGLSQRDRLVKDVNRIFRSVYGRNPASSEHKYWLARIQSGEKSTKEALQDAMIYHRHHGIKH